MLTLYYYPGACSTASRIALEETHAPYEAKLVAIPDGEQRTEGYLAINPRGQVPALRVEDKIITESVAILVFIAQRYPEAKLLPGNDVDNARCIATLAWIASAVDPVFRRASRPERFVAEAAAQPAVKDSARETYWSKCEEIDRALIGKDWIAGDQYTCCDPYALVYYGWGVRLKLPMDELKNFTAWKDRMLGRPAVRKVLELENSPLLKP